MTVTTFSDDECNDIQSEVTVSNDECNQVTNTKYSFDCTDAAVAHASLTMELLLTGVCDERKRIQSEISESETPQVTVEINEMALQTVRGVCAHFIRYPLRRWSPAIATKRRHDIIKYQLSAGTAEVLHYAEVAIASNAHKPVLVQIATVSNAYLQNEQQQPGTTRNGIANGIVNGIVNGFAKRIIEG